jgi:hypothetical protein
VKGEKWAMVDFWGRWAGSGGEDGSAFGAAGSVGLMGFMWRGGGTGLVR